MLEEPTVHYDKWLESRVFAWAPHHAVSLLGNLFAKLFHLTKLNNNYVFNYEVNLVLFNILVIDGKLKYRKAEVVSYTLLRD